MQAIESNQRGRFITLEGPDGAGKSSQVETILRTLSHRGVEAIATREPGGTQLGEAIRQLVKQAGTTSIGNNAELLLIFAARAQHLDEVILPALAQGRWVVSDRFTDATYAYQGGGRGINVDRIHEIEQWVQGDLQPDLTLLFNVSINTANQRANDRNSDARSNDKADRFDSQSLKFKERIRNNYLRRQQLSSGRMKLIDGEQSLECVTADTVSIIDHYFQTISK